MPAIGGWYPLDASIAGKPAPTITLFAWIGNGNDAAPTARSKTARSSRAVLLKAGLKKAPGDQNAGTTAPLYLSRMNCLVAGARSAAMSLASAGLWALSARLTTTFT